MTTITLTIRVTLMKLITPITQRRNNQTGITNHNINLMRVQVQNQCDRTGELASITYVRDVQGSLGGDKRHDAGRVTVVCGKPKCSHSLRSARLSYTHPTVLGTRLVPNAFWRTHLTLTALITKTNPINLKT